MLLSARDIHVSYLGERKWLARREPLHVVNGVSFDVHQKCHLGIVGESGCGKSTLSRALMHLVPMNAGSQLLMHGEDITFPSQQALKRLACQRQMVFQDPHNSLNPRMTIYQAMAEPLRAQNHKTESCKQQISEMLERVGLNAAEIFMKYPHELSGGQKQRVVIARALMIRPQLVIADEPVAALDMSTQAGVINLMQNLAEEFALTFILISHDLSLVRYFSHHIAVMYLGQIVEIGESDVICNNSQHPYTRALVESKPVEHPRLRKTDAMSSSLSGEIPDMFDPPSGCALHPRCPFAQDRCSKEVPSLRSLDQKFDTKNVVNHQVACHFPLDVML